MKKIDDSFTKFDVKDGDTSNCPPPAKGTKFLSIKVEVITPLGRGTGVYNYMDGDWLVELYDDDGQETFADELQSYKEVTHWRYIIYKTEEQRADYQLTRDMLKGSNSI